MKLESLWAGYHDPTLLKIYKKVLDPTLPAPHEKLEFSHYSSDQNKIKEEVKRTFQRINAKQAFLKSEINDIIDFLKEEDDLDPLEELEKRKLSVKPHEGEKCNKKLFDDDELHEALFNTWKEHPPQVLTDS